MLISSININSIIMYVCMYTDAKNPAEKPSFQEETGKTKKNQKEGEKDKLKF